VTDAGVAPADAQPAQGHVRVIHASPDPSASTLAVDLFVERSATAALGSLAYRATSGYIDAPEGNLWVEVRRRDATSAPPALAAQAQTLQLGHKYTVIVYGTLARAQPMALASTEDFDTEPPAGHARLRLFHALVGVGAVDVCTRDSPPVAVFSNAAYGRWGFTRPGAERYDATVDVRAGSPLALDVRAYAESTCAGPLVGQFTITPPERSVLTLVAVGGEVSASSPAIPREVLLCTDAPRAGSPGCEAVSIRSVDAAPAGRTNARRTRAPR
jgi:hypothetical protein